MPASLQEFPRQARTKIVATVGPACRDEASLRELVAAGVDVFRLNMAHGTPAEQDEILAAIERAMADSVQPVGVLIDLAGPKIRLGAVPDDELDCQLGATFHFVRGETPADDPDELTCSYPQLIDELAVGDAVMLADGTVSMEVIRVLPDRATCVVVQPGIVRSRQGINLPGVTLSVPTLGPRDLEHAEWAATRQIDFVSLSFVRAPSDVSQLKDLLRKRGSHAKVVAKIEKREALDQLEAIVDAADAVMVARGDLGVETDAAEMPMAQKRIVATCRRYQRPVIIATQMLESMHYANRPTRAEATDVANAILDGGDACMLSGETAIGEHPRTAVEMMNRIALATEATFRDRPPESEPQRAPEHLRAITWAVVRGTSGIAHQLRAKLVVVASHSGATALALSGQRNFVPTLGVSDDPDTLRQMCLLWGVTPLPGVPVGDFEALKQHVEAWGRDVGYLEPGDRIVIVAGSHPESQVHDLVVVHEVGEEKG